MNYDEAISAITESAPTEDSMKLMSEIEEKWVRIIRELAVCRGLMTLTKDKILACWRNEPCMVRADEAAYVKCFRDTYEYWRYDDDMYNGDIPALLYKRLNALKNGSNIFKRYSYDIPVSYGLSVGDKEDVCGINKALRNHKEFCGLEIITMVINLDLEKHCSKELFLIPARLYDCFEDIYDKLDFEVKEQFIKEYLILSWNETVGDYLNEFELKSFYDNLENPKYAKRFYKANAPVIYKEDVDDTVTIITDNGESVESNEGTHVLKYEDISLYSIVNGNDVCIKVYNGDDLVGCVLYENGNYDCTVSGNLTASLLRHVLSKM